MDAKLKAFLRSKGVSEDALDKLEEGGAPDDPKAALRKAEAIDATERLRKLDPDSPALRQLDEMHELLYGINGAKGMIKEMKETIERILKCDREREARDRGIEELNKGHANGHAASDALLAALKKG